MDRPQPLRADRIRALERPFGWIPFRILTCGWFQRLGQEAKLVYFFLCLVADGQGVSYYSHERLCRLLGLTSSQLAHAQRQLCSLDLVAFNGIVYQLLSLPTGEPSAKGKTPERRVVTERTGNEVAHIRQILQQFVEHP